MTIRITCDCGKQLQAPAELLGQPAICPACQRLVTVTTSEAPWQPAATTAPATSLLESAVTDSLPEKKPAGKPKTSKLAWWSMGLGVGSWAVPIALGLGAEVLEIDHLGLLFVLSPLVLGIPAVILGIRGSRVIDRQPDGIPGKRLASTGQILGTLAVAIWVILAFLWLPISSARQKAARYQSISNLRQIGTACHMFHDEHFYLPRDSSGLSWRVHILPFIGEEALYKEFRLDKAWDSPHNQELLPRMPVVFLDPRFQRKGDCEKGLTYYRGFACPGGVLGSDPPVTLINMVDGNGAFNTILAIEAGEPVPWTKPEGPSFDETSSFGGPEKARAFAVLFADGHVQTLPQNFDREMIRRMINWKNTEPVNLP